MVKHIVVGSGLQNVLGLIRSLGRGGYHSVLILEQSAVDECSARFSRYLDEVYCLGPDDDLIELLVSKFGQESEKAIIYTASDSSAAIIDKNYDQLKSHFVTFNANATQGRVSQYMDKGHSFQVAARCGLNLIKTWVIAPTDELPAEVPFPCLVKGNCNIETSKADMAICHNVDELRGHRRQDVSYLIQPFIEKDFELDIVGMSLDHGVRVIIPAVVRKIREELYRQSDYIRLDAISDYPGLDLERIRRFVREVGYEGLFSVELLHSQGTYYFLEMNLRNDGVCYLYTVAGVNFPCLWSLYSQGKLVYSELQKAMCRTPMTLMQVYDIRNLFARKVAFSRWIVEALNVRAAFVFSISDPLPALHATFIHVRQVVRKICKCVCR